MSVEFVDTNVLLYAYDPSEGDKHTAAQALVSRLGRSRSGALSIQVLQEFYVNAVSKIATKLSPSEARDRVRVLGRWTVHRPQVADVLAASSLAEDHQLSFWDAMVIRSASELGCRTLWTEDLNHGQVIAGVHILDPFAPEGPTDGR